MIRKFLDRILGKAPPAPPLPPGVALGTRVEIPASEHGIDHKLIADEPAVRVVETLKKDGYEAYIVGGAVRDLLAGRKPKDFDVATNATPEQVKQLFRRAFIVGRRFRLVHVIHGRGRDQETIEVSTFRAYMDAADATQVEGNEKTSKDALAGQSHAVDASGRVLRDNVWGPQVEDAARRDFTVNAMYYDPTTRIVVDYHGGFQDSRARVLRMIGDPVTRYREDPVRMIRVLRFAAKLGFDIESRTAAPIREMKGLLSNVPASRMFDELIKLLQTGHALASIEALQRFGLDRGVFPILDAHFDGIKDDADRQAFVEAALADTDRRVHEGKPVAPSFLMACMFWFEVRERWRQARAEGHPVVPALNLAIDATFDARIGDISGRGKLASDMREIWGMQPRFEKRTGSSPMALMRQPRARAGLDFMRLRAEHGEADPDLARWWEAFALEDDDGRERMLEELAAEQQQQRAAKIAGKAAGRGAAKGGKGRGKGLSFAEDEDEAGEDDEFDLGAAFGGGAPAPAAGAGEGGGRGGRGGRGRGRKAAGAAAGTAGAAGADAPEGEGGEGGGGGGGASRRAEILREITELTAAALRPDATEEDKVIAKAQLERLQKAANRRRRGGRRRKGGAAEGGTEGAAGAAATGTAAAPAGEGSPASANKRGGGEDEVSEDFW